MFLVTASLLYEIFAFICACVIVFVGFCVADFFRSIKHKRKDNHNARMDKTMSASRYDVERRINHEDKEQFEWALQNPTDPDAFRYLTDVRDQLAEKVGNIEQFRVPIMGIPGPYRDQELARLVGLEHRIAKIDDALPKSANSQQ